MTIVERLTMPRAAGGEGRPDLSSAPALAGIAYTAAWIVGLGIWPSNLDVDASSGKVVSTYTSHEGAAIAQYVFVEGIAAVALAVVVTALYGAARRRGAGGLGSAALAAGLCAAGISLVQCLLGVLLAGWAAPDGHTSRAGDLFDLINRLDGVKMLVLATLASIGVTLVRRAGVLPRWLGYAGAVLAVALVVSGAGYLVPNTTLAQAVFVSGPLLFVWVTGTGLALARPRDERAAER